jgi:hypothetical protein
MSRPYAVALCAALTAVCGSAVGLTTVPTRGQIEMMILTGIFAALAVLIKKKLLLPHVWR